MNRNATKKIGVNFLLAGIGSLLCSSHLRAELLSYAAEVKDVVGVPEADASLALGVPDYVYPDGTFTAGASAVYVFSAPIDDVSGDDLIISAFVSGEGTESSQVGIEARATDSHSFVELETIDTSAGRSPERNPFADFDHVHHFYIDFDGKVDKVTEVRITIVSGDDLKIDALEGLHPAISSPNHAVEIRAFRLRNDDSKRFALRFKNLSPLVTGQAITGFSLEHATDPLIDQTDRKVEARVAEGLFAATAETTAGPDNGEVSQLTEYAWEGEGDGLPPGDTASHQRHDTIDLDTLDAEFIENITFRVTFADGEVLSIDGETLLAEGAAGQLFALYEYPPFTVSINEPRPAYFAEMANGNLVPEPPCEDCVTENENANENENDNSVTDNENDNVEVGNDNQMSNDNMDMPSTPAPCMPGMIGPMLTLLAALSLIKLERRRPARH